MRNGDGRSPFPTRAPGYFSDRCDLAQPGEIGWDAVRATDWRDCKEGKQAEFLVENSFPWTLIRSIGVCNAKTQSKAVEVLKIADHQPSVTRQQGWYY